MNIKITTVGLLISLLLCFSCGEDTPPPRLVLSGSFGGDILADYPDKPVMVAVSLDADAGGLLQGDIDNVDAFVTADRTGNTFSIDLTETGLSCGDHIYVIAFIDNNYSGGIPLPDLGDWIGFYVDIANMKPTYTLQESGNDSLHIEIDREVFSFEASVQGTINGLETGDATLIAYAGQIVSSDLTRLDPAGIIGYSQVEKGSSPVDYQLPILPYGYNVPIEDVYIFALLDANLNGRIDAGDAVGYYSVSGQLPSRITVSEGETTDIDIDFFLTVNTPAGDSDEPAQAPIAVSGDLALPNGRSNEDAAVYIIALDPDNPAILLQNPLQAMRYFERIPVGKTTYRIELSGSGLLPGDPVMLFGLLETDPFAGFPDPSPGDFAGIHFNPDTFSPVVHLFSGENEAMDIAVQREITDFDAVVSGTLAGGEMGPTTIMAYAGEINSLNIGDIDPNAIIGYTVIDKQNASQSYSLPILPLGFRPPMENVYVFAITDSNGNGMPDGGDLLGFHGDSESGFPELITIYEGERQEVDIPLWMTIPEPSHNGIVLEGSFTPPEGYDETSPPVFMLVAAAENLGAIWEEPLKSIRYFCKLPAGENRFAMDLGATSLKPQDTVVVAALWDRDHQAGFPRPTPGDGFGYMANKSLLTYRMPLEDWEFNTNSGEWTFVVDKRFVDHHASLSFKLEGGGNVPLYPGKRLLAVAVQREGIDDQWDGILNPPTFAITDMDAVVAMQAFDISEENIYALPILPVLWEGVPLESSPFAVPDVYLFAVLDDNRNGIPDSGEYLGYYSFLLLPARLDIVDGVNPPAAAAPYTVRFFGGSY